MTSLTITGLYWNDAALLAKPWLRGTGWANGREQVKWEYAQAMAANAWKTVGEQRKARCSSLSSSKP
jgi:hypothetical protein